MPIIIEIMDCVGKLVRFPRETFSQIKNENTDIPTIYKKFVLILAAVPALSSFIGFSLIGVGMMGMGTIRLPIFDSLIASVLSYLINIAGVYIGALIVNFLAPHFSSKEDKLAAFKLVAYSFAAVWAIGIFSLIPALSFLGILGLYSIYLFYVGTPILMETPKEKVLPFVVSVFIVGLVVAVVMNLILGQLVYAPLFSRMMVY